MFDFYNIGVGVVDILVIVSLFFDWFVISISFDDFLYCFYEWGF